MKNQLQEICQQIGPKENGIIWLSNGTLDDNKEYFFEMNYLLDGLLSQSKVADNENFHIYLTQQFSKDFFLIHKNCQNKFAFDELYKVLENSPQFMKDGNKILILSELENNNSVTVTDKLKKKFKHLDFDILKITK